MRAKPDEYAGDYFVGEPGQEGTYVSLRAEALRLLGSMPAAGLQWYQLQYGAQAKRLLDEALAQGDMEKLAEVTRRFFHTQAGYEATVLLGWYHLNRGRPLAAALCLKRVAASPTAVRLYDPELSLLLANLLVLGQRTGEGPGRAPLHEGTPPASRVPHRRIGNQVVRGRQIAARLAPGTCRCSATNARRCGSAMGDVSRRRPAERPGFRQRPLTNFRWFARLAVNESDQRGGEQIQRQYIEQHLPALPAMHPLVIGDTVVMRTPWHLFAIDFETGKFIWYYPWDDSFDKQFLDGQPGADAGLGGPRMQFIQQRTFGDAPYGQLSSDGRHVFLIDELGFASARNFYQTIVQQGGMRDRQSRHGPGRTTASVVSTSPSKES